MQKTKTLLYKFCTCNPVLQTILYKDVNKNNICVCFHDESLIKDTQSCKMYPYSRCRDAVIKITKCRDCDC